MWEIHPILTWLNSSPVCKVREQARSILNGIINHYFSLFYICPFLQETVQYLKKEGISDAGTGIIPGTGLNELLKHIQIIYTIPYSNILHFPKAPVEFHREI